ncbi:MAG: hypothetical protein IJM46_12375 [Oscillospiraceae bacterium]|nr:hypothetical protein [Oscillospiraceae bacterium]
MHEKMKNAFRILYTAAILGMLAVPAAALAVRESRGGDAADETGSVNTENRVLAAKPALHQEDGSFNRDYLPEFDAWFSDSFGLRTQLVTAYSKLTGTIFGVSTEKDVIIGKDGWLYYTPTVPDATGVRTLSDTEMQHIVYNMRMMQDYCEAHGAKLIFAAAPNKASIYPEHLPARYLQTGGQNNLDALHEALAQTGLTVCDWRNALQSAAKDRLLYHKTDTHWNGDGAMLGYQTLMQTLRLDDFGFADSARTETCDWNGDLWDMLSPAEKNPDANAVYAVPQTYRTVGRMRSIDDLSIKTTCENGTGSLLMFRDSFGRALIPLLAERFASCSFQRGNAVPLDLLEHQPADYVVYELVERNLDRLLTHAPQMPAPAAMLPAAVPAEHPETLRLESETNGQYLHIYGLFDEAYAAADAVYVTLNGQSFQAFLCCEQEALALEQHQANGFSCYVPAALTADTVQITVQIAGQYVQYTAALENKNSVSD